MRLTILSICNAALVTSVATWRSSCLSRAWVCCNLEPGARIRGGGGARADGVAQLKLHAPHRKVGAAELGEGITEATRDNGCHVTPQPRSERLRSALTLELVGRQQVQGREGLVTQRTNVDVVNIELPSRANQFWALVQRRPQRRFNVNRP